MGNTEVVVGACALLLAAGPAVAAEVSEVGLKGPFAWGDRNLYVVEPSASAPSVSVVTGVVAAASSLSLSASDAGTTARLEFVGGEPWFYTPSAGWTNLVGGTAFAEGESAAYRMVFDLGEDRATCAVGKWSVGWVPFGGGDELVGYSERTGASGAVLAGSRVPDEYDPTVPKTQWTWTQKTGYGYLTETGIPEGQTPWKFKLTSGGTLTLATLVDGTSSKKINLRTLPADCTSQIKSVARDSNTYGSFMCNVSGLSYTTKYTVAAAAIIEEIFFPDTLTSLCGYAFANCTNLVVCDFTENSRLATIGTDAFYNNVKLLRLRLTERLKTLDSSSNHGTIRSCPKLRLVGPTLPSSLTAMKGCALASCPLAITGRLTLGSDTNGITCSATPQYMFRDMTNITEIVFGAGMATFATSYPFHNCKGITNIVCRNPNGFAFGTYFSRGNNMAGPNQYDLYGWPTGTLVTKNTGTRILARRRSAKWRALVADETVFTPWDKLTAAQQAEYWANFPDSGEAQRPAGRIAGKSGSKTYADCTIGWGVWVVLDKEKGLVIMVR